MALFRKILASACLVGMLAGCADTTGLGTKTLTKGAQVDVRTLIEAHPGQTACIEYDAASNSCASAIKSLISGPTVIATETALAQGPGGAPERITLITKSNISNGRACLKADGVSLSKASQGSEVANFVLSFTKELVAARGEVCGTYYSAGENFVVTSTGADGRPFPPGDSAIRFFSGSVKLRTQ